MPTRYQPLSVSENESSGAAPAIRPYRPSDDSPPSPRSTPLRLSSSSLGPASLWSCHFPNLFAQFWEWIQDRISLPERKKIVGYLAGGLFSVGWWVFIDGLVYVKTREPPLPVGVGFEDWVPGIVSTLALLTVNLIDKTALSANEYTYSGSNVAMKARLCAFIGVTLALGAIGGALAIFSLKYALPGLTGWDAYFGIGIAVQNLLIFLGSMIFWFGRNSGEEPIELQW